MKKLAVWILLIVEMGLPAFAKTPVPLKVIAPDLIVERIEVGWFYDEPPNPLRFHPTSICDRTHLYGWRMKVKTSREKILLQEKSAKNPLQQGAPFTEKPVDGYLYFGTDIVSGVYSGKRATVIYVENVPVDTIHYTIK